MYRKCLLIGALAMLLSLAFGGLGLAQDGDVNLTLAGWSSNPAEDEALQAALDQFMEQNPGVSVEFVPSPDFTVTMQTAFASGDYPEVFYIDSSVLPNWVDAGVVASGEGMIEDVGGMYESLVDVFTLDGTLYCPPKDFSTMALQYNKDLFDAAGVEYPTADWTWDDLSAAAEALTDADAGVVGLVTPAELPRWLPFMFQAGGAIFDAEGNYVFDSPETRAALEQYIGMVRDGIAGPPSTVDAGWGGEAFGTGRAAMAMEGNWVIQFLLEGYPELNWGVTELPAGPAGEATMAFTVCYGVGAANEHPEESWALVNFLTGTAGAEFVAESSFGPMPTRPAVAEAYLETWVSRAEGTAFNPEDIQAFVSGADYAHRWQLPVGWNQFTDTFNASLQRAFDGQMTVDDLIFEVGLVAEELGSM